MRIDTMVYHHWIWRGTDYQVLERHLSQWRKERRDELLSVHVQFDCPLAREQRRFPSLTVGEPLEEELRNRTGPDKEL